MRSKPYGEEFIALPTGQQYSIIEQRIAEGNQHRNRLLEWLDAQPGVVPGISAEDIKISAGPIHQIYVQGTLVAIGWINGSEIIIELAGAYSVFEEQITAALKLKSVDP